MRSSANATLHCPDWVREALRCPVCQTPLALRPGALACASGAHVFPQDDPDRLDLRHVAATDADWSARQAWMEREYSALLDDGDHAAVGFENDFGGIAPLLRTCRGRILDIGGGNGVARHWLGSADEYVLLEPSGLWDDSRWSRFAERLPCLARPCIHVRSFAESLPFASGTFDVALALWSLNHVASVRAAVREALRVLARGGRLLAVLEDAEPSWTDIWQRAYSNATPAQSARHALAKLFKPVRGWPVQRDHLAVSERVLVEAPDTAVVRREWRGLYLTIEIQKR